MVLSEIFEIDEGGETSDGPSTALSDLRHRYTERDIFSARGRSAET